MKIKTKQMEVLLKGCLLTMRLSDKHMEVLKAEEMIMEIYKLMDDVIKEERRKAMKVLDYCKGKTDMMWAATVVGLLIDCDYRESPDRLEETLRSTDESLQTSYGPDSQNQVERN